MTMYAEVIGDPVAQSKSPSIHGFWIDRLGLQADYRSTHILEGEIESYLAERRSDTAWRGCNVTMPHKQAVMPFVDRLEPVAKQIGAVNTIYLGHDGALVGANTDQAGFLEPLREELAQQHYFRMARVIGTGGAARAIVSGMVANGFIVVLAGRNLDKARALLKKLANDGDHHAVHLAHFAEPTDFIFDDRVGCCDLVINASPLGMRGQAPLEFDWSHAPPGSIAYDIVTDPHETDFLKKAREHGHETVDGISMLIGQAAAAFTRFFGVEPPREYDGHLRERLTSSRAR